MADIAVSELIIFIITLLAGGVIAGVIAGLLGVGGGIVIVPLLYYVLNTLGYPQESLMHVAVATSLATIIFTSMRSVAGHHKKGAVDWGILKSWAVWIIIGAVIGVIMAGYMNTRGLMAVFGAVAFFVALQMALGKKEKAATDRLPSGIMRSGIAAVIGLVSTLMGIGGGTFGVTVFTICGVPVHRAVATAAGLGVLIAIPSVIGFIITGWHVVDKPPLTFGYVNLVAFAAIVPMTVLCAPYGVRLAHSMNPRPLKMVFALFLLITSVNMIHKALMG